MKNKDNKKIKKLFKNFEKEHGHSPKYADVSVRFADGDTATDYIKLRDFQTDTAADEDDCRVIGYLDGLTELLSCGEIMDFAIEEIHGFYDEI